MTAKNTGGYAFPCTVRECVHPGHVTSEPQFADVTYPGMTLRDYFAAQALSALIRRFGIMDEPANAVAAEQAYALADAMLAERAKAADL